LKLSPDLLRHGPEARVVIAVESHEGDHLVAKAGANEPWPRLLDGAAQAAGLLARALAGAPLEGGVLAEVRDLRFEPGGGADPRIEVVFERRVLGLWRFGFTVRSGRRAILSGRLTLAFERAAPPEA